MHHHIDMRNATTITDAAQLILEHRFRPTIALLKSQRSTTFILNISSLNLFTHVAFSRPFSSHVSPCEVSGTPQLSCIVDQGSCRL